VDGVLLERVGKLPGLCAGISIERKRGREQVADLERRRRLPGLVAQWARTILQNRGQPSDGGDVFGDRRFVSAVEAAAVVREEARARRFVE